VARWMPYRSASDLTLIPARESPTSTATSDGSEKSLSRLDSPHNRAKIVLRSGTLGMSRDLVDPAL
jgi:hypothetical protein